MRSPWLCALVLGAPSIAGAQYPPTRWIPVVRQAPPDTARQATNGVRRWVPPLASALVPGTGQLMLGRDRGAVYLAVEALLIVRFLSFQRAGRLENSRYRDLAFNVARTQFNPVVRDTVFEYFEQLGRFIESGPFDTDTGAALEPPTDERTYNGSIWTLARRTFLEQPDSTVDPASEGYQRALEFYRTRAIGPNFRWSWRNAGLEQDLYRRTIQASDEGFRQATQQLGLLLANHLLSVIDAFITGRLSGSGRRIQVQSVMGNSPYGRDLAWAISIRAEF